MTTSIKLTFEEASTLLAQIEACLNSRPICALTTDINDLEPLTPGHLLISAPLNLIPEPSLIDLKDNTLDRFQSIQKGLRIIWKRFHSEYLHAQHPRKKWYKPQENIAIGDLVVIIDENARRRTTRLQTADSEKNRGGSTAPLWNCVRCPSPRIKIRFKFSLKIFFDYLALANKEDLFSSQCRAGNFIVTLSFYFSFLLARENAPKRNNINCIFILFYFKFSSILIQIQIHSHVNFYCIQNAL